MSVNFVEVHPLVLLNVVDHVTRLHLSHESDPPPTGPFFSTVGLLMGTTSVAAAVRNNGGSSGGGGGYVAAATTTLATSFELPLKLNDSGEPIPLAALAGDAAFLARVLEDDVDWPAAQQHRALLDAVMPESSVVGCYLVCSGGLRSGRPAGKRDGDVTSTTRSKKPRNESQRSAQDTASGAGLPHIGQSLATQLHLAELLPAAADGFVVLVFYEGEVVAGRRGDSGGGGGGGGGTDDSSSSSAAVATTTPSSSSLSARRLPLEAFWVSTVPVAAAEEAGEAADRRRGKGAVPAPVAVTPADMEWIGLANEVHIMRDVSASTTATPTTPSSAPSFLRRVSAALYPASAQRVGSPTVDTPTAPLPSSSPQTATTNAAAATTQNSNAADGLRSSLRLLSRVLATPSGASTMQPTAPGTRNVSDSGYSSVELLRTVATCVRNVPDDNAEQQHEQQHPQSTAAPDSEDVLRAVLALEAQCAMRLADLQRQQRSVVIARMSAMSSVGRRGLSSPSLLKTMSAKRGAMRSRAGDVEEARSAAAGAWIPPRHDGRERDSLVTYVSGHVWPHQSE
ncbi:hypothetical protein ABB37_08095 [Leptomonas pyrrhocoris]|uniref:Uncharacterized protein n=1 Tax=Leptomonas pyrrhocoris TaxID=157538 RepID=A0A0M9FTZ9_LEPPY|nr:hypothetical protein ABB37_08095 [Leptomonas pyrrhocoris]KPA75927.1 hypothetical protein ABB37_08095 [Leptomonas pyrrhocoris]|eukprot:XP_015654366.1 hypothetical protein ABB37_08095 [Leptomonas pyrrhocoris]